MTEADVLNEVITFPGVSSRPSRVCEKRVTPATANCRSAGVSLKASESVVSDWFS